MKKIVIHALLTAVGVFVIVQFIQPDRTNPPVDPAQRIEKHVPMSPMVKSLLRDACFDCHSNETSWPWYSYVSPVSWIVNGDVTVGRQNLNFSEWGRYAIRRQAGRLGAISEEVRTGAMPLSDYVIMHGEADLTSVQRDSLIAWAEAGREYLIRLARQKRNPDLNE